MANLIPDFLQQPTHIGPVPIPSLLPEQNKKDQMASDVLKDAGWPSSLIPTALGIIQAESSRNAGAVNGAPCSKAGDHAIGWFQVCTVNCGAGGTSRDKSKCTEQLKDVRTNSKAALAVYRSQGWGAWTTYHPGIKGEDFKVTVDTGAGSTPTVDNPSAVANTAAASTGLDAIGDTVRFLSTPDSWFRIGKVVLGFSIVALCLALFLFKLGIAPPGVAQVAKTARKATK